ncbi:sulfotransferase family 2 domain-containing protein [bacterium]|nr:sulfotransferase family 2 domain-containing protein [bacterium]
MTDRRQQTRPVVFVHIPKAAGSTLHAILAREYPRSRTVICDLHRPDAPEVLASLTPDRTDGALCFRGHMPYGLDRFIGRECDYITILRDPVQRTVSKYHNLVRRPERAEEMGIPAGRLKSLEAFLDFQQERNALNFQTRLISGWVDFQHPLSPYPEPLPDEALRRAQANLEDHFLVAGLQERFDESVVLMKRALGWGRVAYPRRNVDFSRPRQDGPGLPGGLAERIRQLNHLDLQLVAFVGERLERRIGAEGEDFQADLERTRRLGGILHSLQRIANRKPVKTALKVGRRLKLR